MRNRALMIGLAVAFCVAAELSAAGAVVGPGRVLGQAPPDLEAAIGLYLQSHGSVFRRECVSVAPGVVTGTCYETTLRTDGSAEVWLTDLATGASSLILFEGDGAGWYPFTRPINLSGRSPGINAFAKWSDLVSDLWKVKESIGVGQGWISVNSDGTGVIAAGRFEQASLNFGSFQDGIAVGSITLVLPNVVNNAITGVTNLNSGQAAFALLDDGSAVFTSSLYPINLTAALQPCPAYEGR